MNNINNSMRYIEAFHDIISSYIKPLTYGSIMEGPARSAKKNKHIVSFDTVHKIRIYIPGEDNIYFILKRLLPFSEKEKKFVEDIMTKVVREAIYKSNAYHQMICGCVEQSIASSINNECAETIYQVIQVYNQWAVETHEGKRIGHTTGIYLNKGKGLSNSFFELRNSDCLKTLGSTEDTILTVARDGSILALENISSRLNSYRRNQDVLAPVNMADIAMWTNSSSKVALRLTPSGEILVFKDKSLVFAKRRSYWRCFPPKAVLATIFSDSVSREEKESKKALYLTALDIAMSNRGACLGVFHDPRKKQKGLRRISPDVLFSSENPLTATKLLSNIINSRKFFEIPRNIRIDLCTLDGALVLDDLGNILTAGAILKTDGNTATGGGRSAAAKTLAKAGFGIKISSDGYIEVYSGNKPPLSFA